MTDATLRTAPSRPLWWLAWIVVCTLSAALPSSRAGAQERDPCLELESEGLLPIDLAGDEGRVGGAGHSGDESGLGGTGYGGDESGLGGTGYAGDESGLGGTGVFGTVRAFGSICVNGLRIHYPEDAIFHRNGRREEVSELAIGDVVWLRARLRDGSYSTESIEANSAVVGQIESIDVAARLIRVEGRDVRIFESRGDAVVVLPGGFAALRVGMAVDVSGLVDRSDPASRSDESGAVVASRVERAAPGRRFSGPRLAELLRDSAGLRFVSLEGYVEARPGQDRLRVAGVELDVSALRLGAARTAPGSLVRATARVESNGRLVVDRPAGRGPRPPRSDPSSDETDAVDETIDSVLDSPAVDDAPGFGDDDASASVLTDVGDVGQRGDTAGALPNEVDAVEAVDRAATVQKIETVQSLETIERVGTVQRVDAIERVEVSERIERVDVVERADRVDRVERVEQVERVDRVERVEQVERVDRIDRLGSDIRIERIEK